MTARPVATAAALAALGTLALAAAAPRTRPARRARPVAAPAAPAPAPVPPAPAQLNLATQTFTLPGGLACILVENHERPLIRMELFCPWDRAELPAGKEGIGGFLAEVMAAGGAGPYTRTAFLRELDSLGMTFRFEPAVGAYRWSLAADSRSQETAMELLADAVARPSFDGPLVELVRQNALKRAAALPPRDQAAARFGWELEHPAVLAPPGPTPYQKIEFQDLLDFRRRVIRPEGAVLVLCGDLNLVQARQLVLMHLGIWGSPAQAPVKGVAPRPAPPAARPRLRAVLDPGPGAELWAGAPRPAGARDPAAEALLPVLLARAVSGWFGEGGTRVELAAGGPGPLVLRARVPQGDRDRLVPGFTAALAALAARGFTAEDLARARLQWQAERAALPLHPEPMARELAGGRLDPALAAAVDRLEPGPVNAALRAWLDPARLRYLLLGADAPMVQAAEKAGLGPAALAGD